MHPIPTNPNAIDFLTDFRKDFSSVKFTCTESSAWIPTALAACNIMDRAKKDSSPTLVLLTPKSDV